MDLKRKQFKTEFAGKQLVLEVSSFAGQANAAVIGRYGDTAVLVTAVMSEKDKDADYFPLIVDYEERFYAAGKILGSRFIRREGRPSEDAILSGRLIDRTIRPLFDQRIRREVQVVVTILELGEESDLEFITLLAASAALSISDIPWAGPVAGVKIFHNWPSEKGFVSFVAGTAGRINMIEMEGIDADESEIAKEFLKDKLEAAIFSKKKQEQQAKAAELRESLKESVVAANLSDGADKIADHLFDVETDELVHRKLLEEGERPDGRKLDEVRDLYGEVGILKRTHGSALFVRGDTQALVVTTIAPPGSEQLLENMRFSGKRRFMLHYNFPPYSTGEVGRVGNPGRREIGHGALAEKAVRNIIPSQEEFPYAIRVVSEIVSSNGSSSQATVCGTSMSLMDAGVPIKKAVAGIAMGLMTGKKGEYKVLTDIQGPEDHHGDMDFKVAGTADGVRAIQMDVKIDGITNQMRS